MRIPKIISKNNREYIFVKQCNENLFLYKEMLYGYKECFLLQDLIQIKNNIKIRKNIKPEMDRYF